MKILKILNPKSLENFEIRKFLIPKILNQKFLQFKISIFLKQLIPKILKILNILNFKNVKNFESEKFRKFWFSKIFNSENFKNYKWKIFTIFNVEILENI